MRSTKRIYDAADEEYRFHGTRRSQVCKTTTTIKGPTVAFFMRIVSWQQYSIGTHSGDEQQLLVCHLERCDGRPRGEEGSSGNNPHGRSRTRPLHLPTRAHAHKEHTTGEHENTTNTIHGCERIEQQPKTTTTTTSQLYRHSYEKIQQSRPKFRIQNTSIIQPTRSSKK